MIQDYAEWLKTRKEFCVQYEHIEIQGDKVFMNVRVGNHSIKVGDMMGGGTVLHIQAYGKELEETGGGLVCGITLDKMPSFIVIETGPDIQKMRNLDD